MLKLQAYIRHDALEPLRRALSEAGLPSLTVTEAYGAVTEGRRRALRPRLRLEMVVQREDADRAVALVVDHARLGRPGDGTVFLLPVEDAVRIRTTQRGREVTVSHSGLPE